MGCRVDRPIALEEFLGDVTVKQFEGIFDIVLKRIETAGIAFVFVGMHFEDVAFDEIANHFAHPEGRINHLVAVDHIGEDGPIHDPNLKGDIGVFLLSIVLVDATHIAIFANIEDITMGELLVRIGDRLIDDSESFPACLVLFDDRP